MHLQKKTSLNFSEKTGMKHIYILTAVLMTACQLCLAQTNNKGYRYETIPGNTSAAATSSSTGKTTVAASSQVSSFSWDRVVLGGSLGMGFGDFTNINISPQIGYMVNRYVTLGGGFSYNYYEQKNTDYTRNYLGANLYARAYPVQYLTLYAQPEVQRSWGKNNVEDVFACLLLGAGTVIPMGNGGVTITFYYDVLQHSGSPYGNKIGYAVGYMFRL